MIKIDLNKNEASHKTPTLVVLPSNKGSCTKINTKKSSINGYIQDVEINTQNNDSGEQFLFEIY